MTVGGPDQVANNYYTIKQGTLLFATVHKLTGLITVLRLLVQGGGGSDRERGSSDSQGGSSDSSFFLKILSYKQNITNPTQKIYLFYLTRWQHNK